MRHHVMSCNTMSLSDTNLENLYKDGKYILMNLYLISLLFGHLLTNHIFNIEAIFLTHPSWCTRFFLLRIHQP